MTKSWRSLTAWAASLAATATVAAAVAQDRAGASPGGDPPVPPSVAFAEGQTVVLGAGEFEALVASFVRSPAGKPAALDEGIEYFQIVKKNGQVVYVVNGADDYRELPAKLGNDGPTIETLKGLAPQLVVRWNPKCTAERRGHRIVLKPPGCDRQN